MQGKLTSFQALSILMWLSLKIHLLASSEAQYGLDLVHLADCSMSLANALVSALVIALDLKVHVTQMQSLCSALPCSSSCPALPCHAAARALPCPAMQQLVPCLVSVASLMCLHHGPLALPCPALPCFALPCPALPYAISVGLPHETPSQQVSGLKPSLLPEEWECSVAASSERSSEQSLCHSYWCLMLLPALKVDDKLPSSQPLHHDVHTAWLGSCVKGYGLLRWLTALHAG